MNYRNKETLFAVRKNGMYTGVYAAVEKAREHDHDSLEEISPILLDGSPDTGYACVAEGVMSNLLRDGEDFSVDYTDLDPAWGANFQSAIAAMHGCGFHLKNVEITTLRAYEIDRDYSAGLPENLAGKYADMANRVYCDGTLEDDLLRRDFIADYCEEKRLGEEYAAKLESSHLRAIVGSLNETRDKQKRIRCGNLIRRFEERLKGALCRRFSMEELRILAVLLEAEQDAEISGQIASGAISDGEIEAMLDRFLKCIPFRRGPANPAADE